MNFDRIFIYMKKISFELIYIILNLFYLFKLKELNNELSFLGKNGLELLAYDGYKPIHFFIMALIFVILAVALIYYRIKILFFNQYNYDCDENVITIILYFVFDLVICFLVYKTIHLIYIPILKTILSIAVVGFAFVFSSTGEK